MFARFNTHEADLELVLGSFETDTSNAPVNVRGVGFTVAYSATGIFTVTIRNGDPVYKEVVSWGCQLEGTVAAVAANSVTAVSTDADGTDTAGATLVMTTVNSAGAAIATLDGPRVNFWAWVRRGAATTDGSVY